VKKSQLFHPCEGMRPAGRRLFFVQPSEHASSPLRPPGHPSRLRSWRFTRSLRTARARASPCPCPCHPAYPLTKHPPPPPFLASPAPRAAVGRVSALPVVAKQNALQRERLAETQRSYNRARRSAIATRMKKVREGGERAQLSPPNLDPSLPISSSPHARALPSQRAPSLPQVFKAILAVGTPAAEADLAPVETLISEAFQEIDKAVQKGVLHANTGARRKARLSAAKRAALIKGGLYTPA